MIKAFPSIKKLAQAAEDDLMRQWQGLGYYSRARNLHKAAKEIMSQHHGRIPKTYDELIQLPGIGPYTAAAISSFAFGERRAVVDGNVYRVLSRYHAIDTPINSGPARQLFTGLAMNMLGEEDPAAFNQAIMNLGAQICTPKNPICADCPLSTDCQAYADSTQHLFPVKRKKKPIRERYFHYLDIHYKTKTVIEKRREKDIWQGLYQFPLIERNSSRALPRQVIESYLVQQIGTTQVDVHGITEVNRQILSHQHIHARFYKISVFESPKPAKSNYTLVFRKNLKTFAFPRSVTLYLHSIKE
jgi:A/G-specific adenine glycosylase